MSQSITPRYEPDPAVHRGEHAVVVGASMAGLLAARVLDDAFDRVTVIERDSLTTEPAVRRGVPQGRHVHALQAAGRETLEALFPGYSDALVTAGAQPIDIATDFNFYDEGDFIADGPTEIPMYCASRPVIEHETRRRVADRTGVTIRDGCQVTDVRLDPSGTTVTGVTVRPVAGDEPEDVDASLVVDATGRTSHTPAWLSEHGYAAPPEDEVHIDLTYATVHVDRPHEDQRAFHVMPNPPRARGSVVLPVEGDRWVLTLFGLHGDQPPGDVAGLADFAAGLPVDDVARLLAEREVVSDGVARYPMPSNLRRRYWELTRFPDGLVVIGDAVASFNPIYGQGISVAALEALHLHATLSDEGDNIGSQLFDAIEPVVADAWNVAVGADFRFEATDGPKPTGTDLLNRYLARLTRKAQDDGQLADAYSRVVTLQRRPTSLLHPRIAWRVLKPAVGRGT